MDGPLLQVVLHIILLLVVLLAPLIPACVLLKLFPETKIFVNTRWQTGPLGDMQLNTSSAAAAYFALLAISLTQLGPARTSIDRLFEVPLTVVADITLLDPLGAELSAEERQRALEYLQVSVQPTRDRLYESKQRITLPNRSSDWYVSFSLPGFVTRTYRLRDSLITSSGARAELSEYYIGRVPLQKEPEPYAWGDATMIESYPAWQSAATDTALP